MAKASGQPESSLSVQLSASAIAGFTAAAFSLPFDMCKSRLQNKNQYTGIVDVFTQILKKVHHSFLSCLYRMSSMTRE